MKYARCNFEADDSGIKMCDHQHDIGSPCEYRALSSFELLEIINAMRSYILKTDGVIRQLRTIDE